MQLRAIWFMLTVVLMARAAAAETTASEDVLVTTDSCARLSPLCMHDIYYAAHCTRRDVAATHLCHEGQMIQVLPSYTHLEAFPSHAIWSQHPQSTYHSCYERLYLAHRYAVHKCRQAAVMAMAMAPATEPRNDVARSVERRCRSQYAVCLQCRLQQCVRAFVAYANPLAESAIHPNATVV